jgi:hypothetical protein
MIKILNNNNNKKIIILIIIIIIVVGIVGLKIPLIFIINLIKIK